MSMHEISTWDKFGQKRDKFGQKWDKFGQKREYGNTAAQVATGRHRALSDVASHNVVSLSHKRGN